MRRSCLLLATLLSLPLQGGNTAVTTATPSLAEAHELFTSRRDADAQAAFERLFAIDPANHEAVYHLGRLAKRRGDWKATAEHYERCTQLAPTNALYWVDLGEAYGKLAGKAGVFQQLGLARKCRAALEKAIDLAPDKLDYRHGLIEFYEKAPAIAGGGRDKALAQAAAIALLDPFDGALTTGGIQGRAKNWTAAATAYRSAAALRPEAAEPPAALGLIAADQGHYEEAFSHFDRALAIQPDHLAALYQLGRVSALSGQRLRDGAAALRRYLEQPDLPAELPRPQHAHYRLGQILARQGNSTAAKAAFQTALQLDPKFKEVATELKKIQP